MAQVLIENVKGTGEMAEGASPGSASASHRP
jgi:hypothetical protein